MTDDSNNEHDNAENDGKMRIAGRTIEPTKNPPSAEMIAKMDAEWEEFERQRAQVKPEDQVHITAGRYGADDFVGTEYEEWVLEQRGKREQKNREKESGGQE
jgi:2-iminoacetate synthase ThiH